mgnify:CR=1 FL=1
MMRTFRWLIAVFLVALAASCAPGKFKTYNGPPVTQIVVNKSARQMLFLSGNTVIKSYNVGLGNEPRGHKQFSGDGKTPEGIFKVDRLNDQSKFHLSLGLNYPRPQDRKRAKAAGVDPGGDIMIHGQPNQVPEGYRVKGDWTAGCIAVTNAEVAEIFAHAKIGTEVEIRP